VPVINLISLEPQERVTAVLSFPVSKQPEHLAMATLHGEVKKVAAAAFAVVRSNGLIAMDLEPGDELGWVQPLNAGDDVLVVTEQGKGARFPASAIPARSRAAGGVRSVRLAKDDRVCGMEIARPDAQVLIVSANGHAKRTPVAQFPVHHRGVGGVMAMRLTEKSGPVAIARVVDGTEEAMVISAAGTVLRTPVVTISAQGRGAQGVALINLKRGDRVACLELLTDQEDSGPPELPGLDTPRVPRLRARRGEGEATPQIVASAGDVEQPSLLDGPDEDDEVDEEEPEEEDED
jgi:DNA gyrase subunit A